MSDSEHSGGRGNPLRSRSARRALRFPAPIAALLLIAVAAACSSPPTPTPTAPPAPTAAPTPAATPTPRIIASLAAPAGVEASAADRTLIVSWSPVAGAAGYVVAARFANGVEPFEWREYDADAPPYVIADNWAAMSGLQYEVRAASVSDDGWSEWSPAVTVTAPELRLAPAGSISVAGLGLPYAVGDHMHVNLLGQRPFTRRSPFVWSVCEMDGSRCELLPIARPTYNYSAPEAARGKRVHVQVDYDKDGLSYAALAYVGVVNPEDAPRPHFPPSLPDGCEDAPPPSGDGEPAPEASIFTHLHYLTSESVPVDWDSAGGGAIEPLCNDLLVVTPWGRMALLRSNGGAQPIAGRVPMNLAGLQSHQGARDSTFRVADILLKQRTRETWELYATHHYFTGECIRFRLSAAEILMDGGSVSVSPSWRTVFDAEPCLPPTYASGHDAGGSIVADGADHLLIVIGSHGEKELPQDPGSHMGKLVRVAIATGEAEILSFGLRNSQGLARDEDGNLWATDHGPQGGDELNLLEAGANYGWPLVSYGVGYGGYPIQGEAEGGHEEFAKPRFAWIFQTAISALVVNDERAFPLWKDDLLAGSLSGESLLRIRRDGTDVQYVERIKVGYRIRDLALMPDGRIAVLGDDGHARFLSRLVERCDERPWPTRRVYGLHCYSPGEDEAADAQSEEAPAGPGDG